MEDAFGMARGWKRALDRHKEIESAHSRFFTALVLTDAINRDSIGEVVDFWSGVAGGKVTPMWTTFAGVAVDCRLSPPLRASFCTCGV